MTIETMTRIEWHGGENPVREGETLVKVWCRDGTGITPARADGSSFVWVHDNADFDIIAYAVTPERAPETPAKDPTMDAVEAATDAQALAALRDEMVAAIRDIRAEKSFAGGAEYFGGDDLSQWEREVIADRLLSIVTREANFAGDRALSAARPFIAAEWQPIETAPLTGERILVSFGTMGVYAVSWDDGGGYGGIWQVDDNKHGPYPLRGYSEQGPNAPTRWQPLPAPPTAIKETIR